MESFKDDLAGFRGRVTHPFNMYSPRWNIRDNGVRYTSTEFSISDIPDIPRKHNNYGQIQIHFLLTLKSFVLQKGAVEKRDLVNAPFTRIHPQGIRGIFKPNEIDEILRLTERIEIKNEEG